MSITFSSIPTSVRKGFELRSLPHRALPLSMETLSQVMGDVSDSEKRASLTATVAVRDPVTLLGNVSRKNAYRLGRLIRDMNTSW